MNKYLPLFCLFPSFAAAAEEPIEVIIYAEEMGYGGIQCNDPERGKIPTPNIDKSACQTMRFTDAHSSFGICAPFRHTLPTGSYHWRSRLHRGIVGFGEAPPIIPEPKQPNDIELRRYDP